MPTLPPPRKGGDILSDKPGEQTVLMFRLPIEAKAFCQLAELAIKAYGEDIRFTDEAGSWVRFYRLSVEGGDA